MPVIGILIAYFAWWQPQWKAHEDADLVQQIDARAEAKLKEHHFDDMATNVSKMEQRMTDINDLLKIVVQNELKHVAELPPAEIQKALPQVRAVLAVAASDQRLATPDSGQLDSIKTKFRQVDRNAPDFWPATAALISFQSGIGATGQPDCWQQNPPFGSEGVEPAYVYSNCKLRLDSVSLPAILWERGPIFEFLIFQNCTISYGGGRIVLPHFPDEVNVKLEFKDCKFVLVAPPQPTPGGRKLLEALLDAKTLNSVKAETPFER